MTATPGLQPTPQFFVPKGPLFPILCPEIRVFVRDLRDLRLLPYLCRPMKHSKAEKYPFPSPNCSGEWRSYRRILLAGTLFTLLFALLSRGFYHPDEHFQILEYAHLKLFGAETTDYLPWEYHAMMRPGLQPFIAWLLGRSRRSAFIAGVLGIILADAAVGVVNWSRGIQQAVHLGSAGALDAIVLSGVSAVLLCELFGEIMERIAHGRADAPHEDGAIEGGSRAGRRETRPEICCSRSSWR